jgi:hypothetical protein
MQQHLRPSIEAMESRALLSSMALGHHGHHAVSVAPAETRVTASDMAESVTTNQSTYVPGQVVQMTFTVTNDSGRVMTVPFGPSIDGFYVMHGGKTVWRSNPSGPEDIGLRRLMPGQSITFTADWKASANTGAYAAHNRFAPSLAAPFTVVPASSGTPAPSPTPTPTLVVPNPPGPVQPVPAPADPTGTTAVGPTGSSPSPIPSPSPSPSPSPAPTPSPSPSNPNPSNELATSVTTNASTYVPGQTVDMTFTETNDTGQAVSVIIGPSIDGFYVTEGSQTVWRSNTVAPDYLMVQKLQPGQSITLTADWTAPSSAGTYVVYNQLDPTVTATFTVAATTTSPPVTAGPLGSTAV